MENVLIVFLDLCISYFTIGWLFKVFFIDFEDFTNIMDSTDRTTMFGEKGRYANERNGRVQLFFLLTIGILALQFFILSEIYEEIILFWL